ncbi:hypothetical protein RRG08_001939 [Elysia crispata]|uniref:Uncharacterized protein n=1 Tax=Elysia crispata TaxID=231223 RepID=A0AAE1BBX3_9GAST|nr:hypothetical protein RRG08_001939 [Elysia crispata]
MIVTTVTEETIRVIPSLSPGAEFSTCQHLPFVFFFITTITTFFSIYYLVTGPVQVQVGRGRQSGPRRQRRCVLTVAPKKACFCLDESHEVNQVAVESSQYACQRWLGTDCFVNAQECDFRSRPQLERCRHHPKRVCIRPHSPLFVYQGLSLGQ